MNVEIAERLASRRKDAGLSQEELAMQLGVSRQAVSKWERSESSPDTNNLIALAKLYDVSLDDLLYVDSSIEDDIEFEIQDRSSEWVEVDDDEDFEYEDEDDDEYEDEEIEDEQQSDAPSSGGSDYVHISWRDGIHIKDSDDGDEVHVGWNGVHVIEGGSDPTEVTWQEGEGVYINGTHYDSWHDAVDAYNPRNNAWMRFPYPILALLVFLWIGFVYHQWTLNWLVFLTIPVYYMLINAFMRKTFDAVITALYTLGATVWFFYMGLAEGVWHPTWLVFVTIPLFAWLSNALFGKKHSKEKESDEIIVE